MCVTGRQRQTDRQIDRDRRGCGGEADKESGREGGQTVRDRDREKEKESGERDRE